MTCVKRLAVQIMVLAHLLFLSGCVDRSEFLGFLRTEVARITADTLGQVLLTYYRATT